MNLVSIPAATLVPDDSLEFFVSVGKMTWKSLESGWMILTLLENLSLFLSLKIYFKKPTYFFFNLQWLIITELNHRRNSLEEWLIDIHI